ncbi:unnamed protein product [Polarella glacialis]|uniref:Uncharacterized protein n=1 Tax=Polarella glacialis TaxID=89957 RepID=A0A813FUP2_POLGL|nr:unnamed protein product [Polarella glacialis]
MQSAGALCQRAGEQHDLRRITVVEWASHLASKHSSIAVVVPASQVSDLGAEGADPNYVVTFGRYTGKTLEWVTTNKDGCCEWLVKSKEHLRFPWLQEALVAADFLADEGEGTGLSVAPFMPSKTEQLQDQLSKKRKHESTAVVQTKNCTLCGATDHNAKTCPRRSGTTVVPSRSCFRSSHVAVCD